MRLHEVLTRFSDIRSCSVRDSKPQHHKHIGEAGQVVASEGTTLDEVLVVIRATM